MPNVYVDLIPINKVQTNIMLFVDGWVRKIKTPVPQHKIIIDMQEKGTKHFTTVNALNSLVRKGFLRKSCIMGNKTSYVQIRRVYV